MDEKSIELYLSRLCDIMQDINTSLYDIASAYKTTITPYDGGAAPSREYAGYSTAAGSTAHGLLQNAVGTTV